MVGGGALMGLVGRGDSAVRQSSTPINTFVGVRAWDSLVEGRVEGEVERVLMGLSVEGLIHRANKRNMNNKKSKCVHATRSCCT